MSIILNKKLTKKNFDKIFNFIFEKYNKTKTLEILESLKTLGLVFSTKAGFSLSFSDLKTLKKKNKIKSLINNIKNLKLKEIKHYYNFTEITNTWNKTNDVIKKYILFYLKQNEPFNQMLTMLNSGARGNQEQIHQLVGLRSLMVDQTGSIVTFPIKKSFMDGLNIFDYLLSSFGARKGIVDTALKTADSGYLTRRLIESSYEIKIISKKCFYNKGFILKKNKKYELKKTVLTCSLPNNICQNCFNFNFSTRKKIELGESIGILSAQSISEPSTQLTMRTFHTGGIFSGVQQKQLFTKFSGFLFKKLNIIKNWNNIEQEITNYNKKLNNNFYFFNKGSYLEKNKKLNKNILPIFIGFLSKEKNIFKYKKKKTMLFYENFFIKDKIKYDNLNIFYYLKKYNIKILQKYLFFMNFILFFNNYFNYNLKKKIIIINLCLYR